MKFSQFFQDGSGSYSATRLAFLLWAVGVPKALLCSALSVLLTAILATIVVAAVGIDV
jgi:hypothetical protein